MTDRQVFRFSIEIMDSPPKVVITNTTTGERWVQDIPKESREAGPSMQAAKGAFPLPPPPHQDKKRVPKRYIDTGGKPVYCPDCLEPMTDPNLCACGWGREHKIK